MKRPPPTGLFRDKNTKNFIMTIRKELGACGTGRQQFAAGEWFRLSCSLAIRTIITDNYALATTPAQFTSLKREVFYCAT
jgi:hypothetical protein